MRVLHHPDIYKIIPLIAREMINIEYGKKVYDKMTILPYPWKDYITLKYNDVEFGINTREGVICLPVSYDEHTNVFNIISSLTNELKSIQIQLQHFPCKIIPIANNHYQLSGISFYAEDDCIGVEKRIIINSALVAAAAYRDDKYLYKWKIGWHGDIIKLLDFDNYPLKDIILGASCIIWDPENKFNIKDMGLQGNFPTIADLTICNNISESIIQLHPIFGVKWHIFTDAREGHNMTFYKGLVYDELFDNVNLLKFKPGSILKKTRIKSTIIKFKILLTPAKGEIRDIKSEIKDEEEYYDDICHICETKLYGDIYVLEITIENNRSVPNKLLNVHFGLCDICGSDTNLIQHNIILCPNQWKMLRVTFPRTFKEVLELYNYSITDVKVLNYLYHLPIEGQSMKYNKNCSISGNKFHSIENAKKLISGDYKNYDYLFRYSWYDDRGACY